MQKQPSATKLLRTALANAGFLHAAESLIFNDRWKTGERRLKLCFDDAIKTAPLEKQQLLWNEMSALFGDRIKKVEFSPNRRNWDCGRYYGMLVYLKS